MMAVRNISMAVRKTNRYSSFGSVAKNPNIEAKF
jgi:hypothetical protein